LEHPLLMRLEAGRCASLEQVQDWVRQERARVQTRTDTSAGVREGPCSSVPTSSQLVANAALSPPNLCCHLLDRQLTAREVAFEREGGFTQRLSRAHCQRKGRL
jgi:four helix bundle suffix protein